MNGINVTYITRLAENQLNKILKGNKIGVLLGARQVGKSTLVERVTRSAKTVTLNFDVDTDKMRFLATSKMTPQNAWVSLGQPDILILDEAQRLPETARIVKGWHDVRLPLRIVLLGSSSLELLSHAAESLTGRNERLILPPLLFEEALQAQSWFSGSYPREVVLKTFADALHAFLMERLAFGSYPEVVVTPARKPLLRNLAADYLWKDILQTGLVKTPESIKRLLMLLAHQAGSVVSTNELATQLQLARPTVERYLDLLEQCFVVFRLSSFSTHPRKEISKSKKIFFWDTGIRNALLNQFSTDPFRPDLGRLWENWVIAEIAKRNLIEGVPCELFFWRSRHGSEVDLVVKGEDELRAFEIKWRRSRSRCRAFADAYGIEPVILSSDNPFVSDMVMADPHK
jgi:uncharacterized protein